MNGKYLKSFYPHHGWVFLLSALPALWNVYPVESVSYSTGAKPIPLGSAKSKKKITLRALPPGRRPYGPEAATLRWTITKKVNGGRGTLKPGRIWCWVRGRWLDLYVRECWGIRWIWWSGRFDGKNPRKSSSFILQPDNKSVRIMTISHISMNMLRGMHRICNQDSVFHIQDTCLGINDFLQQESGIRMNCM